MVGTLLFVLTSHEELGDTGNKTGSWLHELAAPYWRFRDAGYDVVIASPKGGPAPLDPTSLEDSWISDPGRRFQADEKASVDLANTRRLDDIDPASYAGVFLVGGTATTWDFPGNAKLTDIVETYAREQKVVGAVCHGVIGLVDAMDQNGNALVKNRKVTAISNLEDEMAGVAQIVPHLPENRLRALGAVYTAAQPFEPHVVADSPLFTGQNPASADPLALAILAHLERVGEEAVSEA